MSSSPFLKKLSRRGCVKEEKVMNTGHLKDVLLSHLQILYHKELVDIDIVGLEDPARVVLYLKKGVKVG